jgi:hypothetical protein
MSLVDQKIGCRNKAFFARDENHFRIEIIDDRERMLRAKPKYL